MEAEAHFVHSFPDRDARPGFWRPAFGICGEIGTDCRRGRERNSKCKRCHSLDHEHVGGAGNHFRSSRNLSDQTHRLIAHLRAYSLRWSHDLEFGWIHPRWGKLGL